MAKDVEADPTLELTEAVAPDAVHVAVKSFESAKTWIFE
jgi:hypothetical protein